MNTYEIKREERWKGFWWGNVTVELYKNGNLELEVSYVRRKIRKVESFSGSDLVFKRRWPLVPYFDLFENQEKRFSFFNKSTKVNGKKLWADSRSFIYLGWDQICTIDPWSPSWPGDDSVLYKWEHDSLELELPITFLALLAAVDYADRT